MLKGAHRDSSINNSLKGGSNYAEGTDGASGELTDADRLTMAVEAATTLCELANDDVHMQEAIIQEGGVQPLLQLFRSTSIAAQESAARCTSHLCGSVDNQKALLAEGALAEYVMLLKHGSAASQEAAAAGLAELARGGVSERQLRREQMLLRKAAARAYHRQLSVGFNTWRAFRARRQMSLAQAGDAGGTKMGGAKGSSGVLLGGATVAPRAATVLGMQPAAGSEAAFDGDWTAPVRHPADDVLVAIAECGGIPPLITTLSRGSVRGKEVAVAALRHLAVDSANQVAISRGGAVAPLVALLDLSGTTEATFEYAATLLTQLASSDTENLGQIAKRLVVLLGSGSTIAQVRAARLLNQPQNADIVLNAGALLPLVKMLSSKTGEARREASTTLSTLAMKSEQNLAIATGLIAMLGSGDHGDGSASTHVTELLLQLCGDPSSRAAIAQAGAVRSLVGVLTSTRQSMGLKTRELAASILAHLTTDEARGVLNATDCVSEGAVKPLMGILELVGVGVSAVVESAARAAITVLAALAHHAPKSKGQMVEHGIVEQLVHILLWRHNGTQASEPSATDRADIACESLHAEAANTLWSLSLGNKHGAMPPGIEKALSPLVLLLQPAQQHWRTLTMAAGAIAGLAAGGASNQDAARDEGAIPLLVRLLASPCEGADGADSEPPAALRSGSGVVFAHRPWQVQANGATALSELCKGNEANQLATSEAGAVAHLIELLQGDDGHQATDRKLAEGDDDVRGGSRALCSRGSATNLDSTGTDGGTAWGEAKLSMEGSLGAAIEAATCLCSLADGRLAIQTEVSRCGGLKPLVGLLGSSSVAAQEAAARALAAVSSHSGENEAATAVMVVDLLRKVDDAPEVEKFARAISRLASSSLNNQAAIATAGAIPLLVLHVRSNQGDKPPSMRTGSSQRVTSNGSSRAQGSRGMAADAQHELRISALTELIGALWSMTTGNADNQTELVAEGGVPLLIEALCGDARLHRGAAGGLWALASTRSSRDLIVQADGLAPLLRAIQPPACTSSTAAAGGAGAAGASPSHMRQASPSHVRQASPSHMRGRPVTSPDVETTKAVEQVPADETVAGALACLARDASVREAIGSAGGIPNLVRLVCGSTSKAGTQAAKALAGLVLESPANQAVTAREIVHAMSANSSEEAQERAAELTRDLCRGTAETMTACGGVREAIAAAGGIGELVGQFQREGRVLLLASEALTLLAQKSAELRVQVISRAFCSWHGSMHTVDTQLPVCCCARPAPYTLLTYRPLRNHSAQVQSRLVVLLGVGSPLVRQQAGKTLRSLVPDDCDEATERSLAMAGGVEPVIELLKAGVAGGRLEAQEYAMWSLSLAVADETSRLLIQRTRCAHCADERWHVEGLVGGWEGRVSCGVRPTTQGKANAMDRLESGRE